MRDTRQERLCYATFLYTESVSTHDARPGSDLHVPRYGCGAAIRDWCDCRSCRRYTARRIRTRAGSQSRGHRHLARHAPLLGDRPDRQLRPLPFHRSSRRRYYLRANKAGAGVAIYGANSSRETGENITLADGETRENLKLRFIRSASIEGSVAGPDGDPAINAPVILLRNTRSNGRLVLARFGGVQTDDRGQYRLTNVPPGNTYVFADTPGPQIPGAEQLVSGQLYGGAHDPKDATALSVHDGDRLRGIDFALTAETPVRIRVHVTGVPQQNPPEAQPTPTGFRQGMYPPGLVQISIQPVTTVPAGFSNRRFMVAQAADSVDSGPLQPAEYQVRANLTIDDKAYSSSTFRRPRRDDGGHARTGAFA